MKMRIVGLVWLCAASTVLMSCDALPDQDKYPADRLEAVGRVTMSVPLFTPIEPNPDASKRLSYGDLLKESNIRQLIETPTIGQSRLRADLVRTAFQATIAESGLSPAELGETEYAELSDAVSEKLSDLLGPSGGTFRLPPGQMISLIAAYKTQMVNLEAYYNLPNIEKYIGTIDGSSENSVWGWLPYRVHLTLSLDPSWYVQNQGYDAIADITLAGGDESEHLKVLYVVPGQQAQATQELDAALSRIETQLQLAGQLQIANLGAEIQTVEAAAQRLEGVRSNVTTLVSYPDDNKISVRFRPKIAPVAQGRGHDLSPEPVVLTAVVLGRKYVNGQGRSVFGAPGVSEFHIPQFLETIVQTEVQTNEVVKHNAGGKTFGSCKVEVCTRFVPALRRHDGQLKLPHHDHRQILGPGATSPQLSAGLDANGESSNCYEIKAPVIGYPVARPPALAIEGLESRYFEDSNGDMQAKITFNLICNVKTEDLDNYEPFKVELVGQGNVVDSIIQTGPCVVTVDTFPKPAEGEIIPLVLRVSANAERDQTSPSAETEAAPSDKTKAAPSKEKKAVPSKGTKAVAVRTMIKKHQEQGLASLSQTLAVVEEISVYPSGYFRPAAAKPKAKKKDGTFNMEVKKDETTIKLTEIELSKVPTDKLKALLEVMAEKKETDDAAGNQQQTTVVVGEGAADPPPTKPATGTPKPQ